MTAPTGGPVSMRQLTAGRCILYKVVLCPDCGRKHYDSNCVMTMQVKAVDDCFLVVLIFLTFESLHIE